MRTRDLYYTVAIVILFIFLIKSHCSRERVIVDPYNYVTDTIWMDKDYVQQIEKEVEQLKKENINLRDVPPRTITRYLTPDKEEVLIEKIPDSLIVYIEDLEKRLAISDKYIKNWPEAHKLIDFTLTREELTLGVLTIQGETQRNTYPLYLDQYDYRWQDNKLSYYEARRKRPVSTKGSISDLIFYVQYEYVYSVPKVELEYSLDLNRFRIKASTSLLMDKENPLRGDVGLGYRLFK